MEPAGERSMAPHRPGQFVFLTACPAGQRESHPFSLTSRSGSATLSVLIRPSGDWTELAQDGLAVGYEVALDGPFGSFTPTVGAGAPASQVWVAAGAGITPFLSVLRTAPADMAETDLPTRAELVCIARSPEDMPCWQEITAIAQQLPWLTVRPWFTSTAGRPSPETVRQAVEELPAGSAWYLCGPDRLSAMFTAAVRTATRAPVYREAYRWRRGAAVTEHQPAGVR